jgi:putative ABC transport system substrate-binding protein
MRCPRYVRFSPVKRATRTIPIVFTQVYDPVGSGFVASLAQPGGNITGFSMGEFSLGGKTLEVLKEMAPQVSRVAVILNIEQPPHVAMWSTIRAMAASVGVALDCNRRSKRCRDRACDRRFCA